MRRALGSVELRRITQLLGKAHEVEHQQPSVDEQSAQMLTGADDDLGDTDLLTSLHHVAQQRISALAVLEREKVIGFVEINRADFRPVDKFRNIDGAGCFNVGVLEVFVAQRDVFSLLILVAFNDIGPRDLAASRTWGSLADI